MTSSNVKHPIITFRMNMTPPRNEQVGPNTNPNTTRVVYPDSGPGNDPVWTAYPRGYVQGIVGEYWKSTWIPGFLAGENIAQHELTVDGSGYVYVTAYGQKATYLKNTYTTGDNPLLVVVSNTYQSEIDET